MPKFHTVNKTYSGGGPNALSSNTIHEGQSETNYAGTVNSSTTLPLSPVLVIDPDSNCQCYAFRVDGGNATIWFDGASTATTDTSIALTDGEPHIVEVKADGTIDGVPTASDTYTLRLANANDDSISYDGRMLWE